MKRARHQAVAACRVGMTSYTVTPLSEPDWRISHPALWMISRDPETGSTAIELVQSIDIKLFRTCTNLAISLLRWGCEQFCRLHLNICSLWSKHFELCCAIPSSWRAIAFDRKTSPANVN